MCHRAKHQQLVQRATAAQAAIEEQRRLQQTRLQEARAAEQRYKEMLAHLDPANACAPARSLPAFLCPICGTHVQHNVCQNGNSLAQPKGVDLGKRANVSLEKARNAASLSLHPMQNLKNNMNQVVTLSMW